MRKPAWTLRTGDRISIDGATRTVACPAYAVNGDGSRVAILTLNPGNGHNGFHARNRLTAVEVV